MRFALPWIRLTLFVLMLQISGLHSSAKRDDENIIGCYEKDWMYHDHSSTCIKLNEEREGYTWEQSKSHCERFKIGDNKAHLMVIKDEETNSFLTDNIFPPSRNIHAWIGLFKNGNNWSWQHSFEMVNYTNWTNQTEEGVYAYIISKTGRWGTRPKQSTRLRWICQHDAVTGQMTCPSPVRENTAMTESMICRFRFENATKVKWESIDVHCSYAFCDWKQTCQSDCKGDSFFISVTQDNMGFTTAKHVKDVSVTRDMEDRWVCSIFSGSTLLDNKTCNIRVYEPARDIRCNGSLNPEKIAFSCSTDKIYPKAMCRWWYGWNDSAEFRPLTAVGRECSHVHNSKAANKVNDRYFSSTCTCVLTSSSMSIDPGILNIKVQMYPDIDTFDLTDNVDAMREKNHSIIIERPDRPVFIHMLERGNSSLTVSEAEKLRLSCEVGNGTPEVYQTTIFCQFPVRNSIYAGLSIMDGSSSEIEADVTKDFHGKTCSCWGTHITGTTDNATLVLHVTRGKESVNGTKEGPDDIAGGKEATNSSGIISKTGILIVAVCGGVFVAIVCISMTTVFCVKRKRRKRKMETENVYQTAEPVQEPQMGMDGDTDLFLNDIYHMNIGVVENLVRDDNGPTAGHKDEANDLPYANTSCSALCTPKADEKMVASGVTTDFGKRKRHRSDERVYVEIELAKTSKGADRKVTVKPEDCSSEYATIDL